MPHVGVREQEAGSAAGAREECASERKEVLLD